MNETSPSQPITIKKYANRRLYNTATSAYVTLENLAVMVKEGVEFNVYDAKTSEDITRSVLTQIIVEEEGKTDQQNLLPVGFLRQLIGLYGNNSQWMVPQYLEHSMDMFSSNQDQLKSYFQSTFGNIFPFGTTLEEMGKQNMAMFEQTMRMFTPFNEENGGEAAASANDTCSCEEPCDCEKPCTCAPEEKAKEEAAPKAKKAEKEAVAAPAPAPVMSSVSMSTPMPSVQSKTAAASADDMQQKIANLQRQLADLAKNRG